MFFLRRTPNKVVRNGFRHQHLQTCGGVKNRWPMRTIPDPFLERALILQAITPCAKKAVWLRETRGLLSRLVPIGRGA